MRWREVERDVPPDQSVVLLRPFEEVEILPGLDLGLGADAGVRVPVEGTVAFQRGLGREFDSFGAGQDVAFVDVS